ncbi:DUF6384 family protein [Pseudomonas entomophila]|uniref:DUF6384 family protein n=1 Tax=Pseudomonas entomophila TaxID=312306 RepID=UPI0023D83C33|nr:DUF6384 family protein [Pseudomonas entomophila]MDF0730403.1 DUF6384 family protein [Pseudomonas entomophila]
MTISLAEQMGAMGLVDELRHREMALQEHLDLPRRRAEVAERIRTYYQNQGIAYDDALIDQGVRAFFAQRLVFEAPTLGFKDRVLSKLVLARRALLTLAGAALMIFTFKQCSAGLGDSIQTSDAGLRADRLAQADSALHSQLVEQHQRLAGLRARLQRQPEPAVAALVTQIEQVLPAQALRFVIDRPELITRDNRDQVAAQVKQAQAGLDKAQQALAASQALFTTADGVYQLRDRFTALRQSPGFLATREHFDSIVEQALEADRQLALVRTDADLQAVGSLLDALEQRIESSRSNVMVIERQQQLLQRLKAMPLAAAERQQLMVFANQAVEAIAQQRWEAVAVPLDQLQRYLDFAARALTLELVDRPGVKSGVERCYEPSGCAENSEQGKSWYLVVEALDASGQAVAVPVASVEDGDQRWATAFGVRVSRAEYLKVRQDKLDDGHIGQRRIGSKPANALGLRFSARTSGNPDMITDW